MARVGILGVAIFAVGCVAGGGSEGDDGGDGEGSGGSESGTTGAAVAAPLGLRGAVSEAEAAGDYAAPLRLRVDEAARLARPLLVFSPARLADEANDGVLLVVGGALTATAGRVRGVAEAAVVEVDGTIEVTPEATPAGLPRLVLEGPWEDIGRAMTRLWRVRGSVEGLELTGQELALWVERGRVRVLTGPVVVSARDWFWTPEGSRILLPGEDEAPPPPKLGAPAPKPAAPKLGAAPPTAGPGPRPVAAGPVTPGGDPPRPGGGPALAPAWPTGPSGHVPTVLWSPGPGAGPGPRPPEPGPQPQPAAWVPGAADASPPLPAGPVTLLGSLPLADPPAPTPAEASCLTSKDCDGGQRCVLFLASSGDYEQACSDACADGYDNLCVDDAGCCDIDLVCTEAGTCRQPGTSDGDDAGVGDPGGGGGCNSGSGGCDGDACGGGGCEVSSCDGGGCGGCDDSCGLDGLNCLGDVDFCQIHRVPHRQVSAGKRGGGAALSGLCWLAVFLVVRPRRRRL